MPTETPTRFLPMVVLVGLVAGIVLTAGFILIQGESGAVHGKPHHVRVAVVGESPQAQEAKAVLEHGGAFRVIAASDEADALNLVRHRKADGVVDPDARLLETAQAASQPAAGVLTALSQTALHDLGLRPQEIAPLSRHDSSGIGLLFTTLGLVLGGLPAGLLLSLTSQNRRPRSVAEAGVRILIIVLYSTVVALIVAAMVAPEIGYKGTDAVAIWAWGTALVAAAMAVGAALASLIGIASVPIALLGIFTFGIASAPVPVPWNFMPAFYRVLGPFFAPGAAADGIFRSIYFPAASNTHNMIVLGIWIAVPMVALLAMGWIAEHASVPSVSLADVEQRTPVPVG